MNEAPKEWWICPASDYNSNNPAECCLQGLAGTMLCNFTVNHAPPDDWKTKPSLKYLAFDLEIAKDIPSNGDWTEYRPLGITCAGIAVSDGTTRTFHGYPQMESFQCRNLADYLLDCFANGYQIITWNGLGFDFDVLAEECQLESYSQKLKELALNHIDIAFAMFCDKGFMIGLETAAMGMGLEGKTEGMKGYLAPQMWADKQIDKVLEYVTQDAVVTANVYEKIIEKHGLHWISRSGRDNFWYIENVPTVKESMQKPEPDTSWMSNPWKRSRFYGWTE